MNGMPGVCALSPVICCIMRVKMLGNVSQCAIGFFAELPAVGVCGRACFRPLAILVEMMTTLAVLEAQIIVNAIVDALNKAVNSALGFALLA
jgi:hypothetical protein